MRNLYVSFFAVLIIATGIQAQLQYPTFGSMPNSDAGNQPSMYGPNYPQVQGVNVNNFMGNGRNRGRLNLPPSLSAANPAIQNRLQQTPSTSGPIFPNCSMIDSIGSPVLLVYQAQQIINRMIDPKNSNSFVKYLYYSTTPSSTNGLFQIYQLVFSVSDYSSTYYIGLEFRVAKSGVSDPNWSQSGLGTGEFDQMIIKTSLQDVYTTLGITNGPTNPNLIDCGDLKFIYSSFGNDPRSAVPGEYPGKNRNGIVAALVQNFKAKEKSYDSRNIDQFNKFLLNGWTANSNLAAFQNGWLDYLTLVRQNYAGN